MQTWTDASEVINGNTWEGFTTVVEQPVTYGVDDYAQTFREKMTVHLERVNKNWSYPYNWRVTLYRDGAVAGELETLLQDTFYLYVVECTSENAQARALAIVSAWKGPNQG